MFNPKGGCMFIRIFAAVICLVMAIAFMELLRPIRVGGETVPHHWLRVVFALGMVMVCLLLGLSALKPFFALAIM
jgi:hypothetical protein